MLSSLCIKKIGHSWVFWFGFSGFLGWGVFVCLFLLKVIQSSAH